MSVSAVVVAGDAGAPFCTRERLRAVGIGTVSGLFGDDVFVHLRARPWGGLCEAFSVLFLVQ